MSLQQSDDEAAAIATAPRVTLESLEAKVANAEFFRAGPGGVLTVCVLTMANGFTVTGESACAAPENYNQELGEKFSREQAIRKAWGFEGYLLREKLSEAKA